MKGQEMNKRFNYYNTDDWRFNKRVELNGFSNLQKCCFGINEKNLWEKLIYRNTGLENKIKINRWIGIKQDISLKTRRSNILQIKYPSFVDHEGLNQEGVQMVHKIIPAMECLLQNSKRILLAKQELENEIVVEVSNSKKDECHELLSGSID